THVTVLKEEVATNGFTVFSSVDGGGDGAGVPAHRALVEAGRPSAQTLKPVREHGCVSEFTAEFLSCVPSTDSIDIIFPTTKFPPREIEVAGEDGLLFRGRIIVAPQL